MYTEIKTFEDACNKLQIPPFLPDVRLLRPDNQKAVIANYKLDVIQEAVNEGWKPDWTNWDQDKYFPYFEQSSSGSGFSYADYGYDLTLSAVGSRRVFPSGEVAEYMGNQFLDLYNDAMWIE
jgi:hypothetical protein